MENWKVAALLCWLLATVLYLALPPSSAQMNHAYMGWRLLAGDIPYREFIDMNWPGVMALHAAANWLFGLHMWSFRAMDFICFAIAAMFLADLVKQAAGSEAAKLTLIFAPLIYVGAGYSLAGEHDMTAAQFALVALWFHARGYTRSVAWQLGTGVFLGITMLNKPPVGVLGILLPLQALWLGVAFRVILIHSMVMAVAAFACIAAAMLAVLATGASLSEILDSTYIYNAMTRHLGAVPAIGWINPAKSATFILVSASGVPALIWLLKQSNRTVASTVLPVLWLAGVLSYAIHARALAYNLAPAFLALIGLFSISIELISKKRFSFGCKCFDYPLLYAFIPIAIIGILFKLVVLYWSLPVALASGDYDKHISRFSAGDRINYSEIFKFGNRLTKKNDDECILTVGEQSAINYLLKRPQPTRFYYITMLIDAREDGDPRLPMADRWASLWEEEMKHRSCRFVLIAEWVNDKFLRQPIRAAAAFRKFLDGYTKVGVLGSEGYISVYEKK